MIKVSTFLGESSYGIGAVPLFGPADAVFEKTASVGLLPEVVRYISSLQPRKDAQYVLVNAMGAGEFYSSNINSDWFSEEALMHCPSGWTGNPLTDKLLAKDWPYGFPTFYDAKAFAHHKNKDPNRAYGEVELAVWNDHMKRVELVVRVDHFKCVQFGGMGVWDRLVAGQFPDVSMGTRVCFDLCSICTDWDAYNKALQTFDPKKYRHPGLAVLEVHKQLIKNTGKGIRGLSPSTKVYCEDMKQRPNKILPDGRKVFVYNPYPRMFDISFVFIGADRTAKVMIYIVRAGHTFAAPSAFVAEQMGLTDADIDGVRTKTASVDDVLEFAFLKDAAKNKQSEIDKQVVPSQFAGKAMPIMAKNEPDISDDMMQLLKAVPLHKALATLTAMGIVLKPSEYQQLASEKSEKTMTPGSFMPALARLLLPMMPMRSALGPYIERRIVILSAITPSEDKVPSSHPSEELRKIGSAYNEYRSDVMKFVAHAQDLLQTAVSEEGELHKLAGVPVGEVFTPLAFQYLRGAFIDELSSGDSNGAVVQTQGKVASVQRGLPSRNTWSAPASR